jgi:hypothetical protein
VIDELAAVALWRPTGPEELALVKASGWRSVSRCLTTASDLRGGESASSRHVRMSAARADAWANRDARGAGTSDDVGVDWNEQTRTGLETALNEAEVVGLRLASSDAACELLLHVCAQPEQATDRDPRRVLRLLRATRIRVLLREDRHDGYGPAIPLAGLDDVESFFASLTGWEAMYGWEFLDRPSRTGDWPDAPSLTVDLRSAGSTHSLFWFTECWRADDDARYCIEGMVDFDDLEVLRADGAREPVEQFVAEGRRWWDVLFGRSGQPPQAQVTPAEAPSWRGHRRGSTFVGGQH